MALKSLVVCEDDGTTQPLREILEAIGISVDICFSAAGVPGLLAAHRYDSVILDCDQEGAFDILRKVRASDRNATSLAIAIASPNSNVRQMFALGINFVLYRPLSEERVWSSLRAARTLMQREKRRNRRVGLYARVKLDYANVENASATLVDLSEEGTALQSQRKLPSDCRVYFQFALPGHTSLIRLSGEVVWQDSTGRVGMRFLNVPSSSRRVLHNWLAANALATVSSSPQVPRPDAIAKIAPPPAPASAPGESLASRLRSNPGNRRTQSRHACRLGADVYRVGVPVPNRCSLTDISTGGCYIEMPTPFSPGTHIELVVRAEQVKLRLQGIVQSVHPGFGMGVQLTLQTADDHSHVQSLIRLLEDSARETELAPRNDPWSG